MRRGRVRVKPCAIAWAAKVASQINARASRLQYGKPMGGELIWGAREAEI